MTHLLISNLARGTRKGTAGQGLPCPYPPRACGAAARRVGAYPCGRPGGGLRSPLWRTLAVALGRVCWGLRSCLWGHTLSLTLLEDLCSPLWACPCGHPGGDLRLYVNTYGRTLAVALSGSAPLRSRLWDVPAGTQCRERSISCRWIQRKTYGYRIHL